MFEFDRSPSPSPSPRRCVALRHLAFEDLGVFESELQHCGFSVEYRRSSDAA
ncbi:MAG: hypothetical protein ABI605_11375 [Rhizobacter sp.]